MDPKVDFLWLALVLQVPFDILTLFVGRYEGHWDCKNLLRLSSRHIFWIMLQCFDTVGWASGRASGV